MKKNKTLSKSDFERLITTALNQGATAAAVVASDEIQVRDDLAALCNGEYTCPNYGLASSCPPHVGGPDRFREWQAQSRYSIAVKIELPASVLFSDERNEVMKMLHQIVSKVEREAVEMGLKNSRAFAGGSCKVLFCDDQKTCTVIAENKSCRHLEAARPSMSGFGIDVAQLMISSGWSGKIAGTENLSDKDDTSWVAGLVMLA